MPYQAEQDTTIPKVVGTRKGPMGKTLVLKESINYAAGAIVLEKDIDPDVLSRLEAGDDHLSTLLRYVDPAEARAIMADQKAEFASQFTGEEEVLHLEERLAGDGPTADPSVEVEDGPGYEEPVAGDEEPPQGDHVETGDQTIGQGTSEVETPTEESEEEAEGEILEEDADGASESEGEVETEVADDEAVEDVVDGGDSLTEDQPDEQGNATESQETEAESEEAKVEGDKYDAMDLAELKAEAKERSVKGRSTMKEDQLREALRV